jgi:hypothetical protein
LKLLAGLLSKLKTTQEGGEPLLDRTMVLFGSNFGDANKHTTNNMPVLLAGSGSVQEFRVETSNLGPEFSRFAGGVINMISKSGTNEYHGTAYEFLRNKVLNANTFFNNRSGVATPAFTQNQFGADIGGRVIKDKTFFFVSYEGFRLRQGASTLTSVPTEAMRSGDFQISVPVPERSANILKNRLCTGIRLRSPIGRFSQGGSEASLRE